MRARALIPILMLPLLAACAGNPPLGLGGEVPPPLSQRDAQAEPERHLGVQVQWGGEILTVRNAERFTDVELYGRPLLGNAEPEPDGGEGVRFVARVPGFLDPADYQAGKRLTVRGRLAEPLRRKVGEYAYRYPRVDVSVHHLWPAYREAPDPHRFRDPFYDPWWPWGPWGPWPYRHWPYGWWY